MRTFLFASLAFLSDASFSFAGIASISVDPPARESVITADATGTSFTRVFADPADHSGGNANHGRGNAFRIGGDGTGATFQIDGITVHKDVEQSFSDAAFGLTIYQGTVEQYGLGNGDADGDLFSGTGITNIPIDQELFPLNGLTFGTEDFVTLTLDTPIVVDGDLDYGFALRYSRLQMTSQTSSSYMKQVG